MYVHSETKWYFISAVSNVEICWSCFETTPTFDCSYDVMCSYSVACVDMLFVTSNLIFRAIY